MLAVHEELLCSSSLYFRERQQGRWKPVEGECTICHEDMRFESEEIVLCLTCGGNIHCDYMKEWEIQATFNAARADPVPICQLYRAEWSANDS